MMEARTYLLGERVVNSITLVRLHVVACVFFYSLPPEFLPHYLRLGFVNTNIMQANNNNPNHHQTFVIERHGEYIQIYIGLTVIIQQKGNGFLPRIGEVVDVDLANRRVSIDCGGEIQWHGFDDIQDDVN